ncbi:MAG: tryptophan-rich sensory protein [Alphaproteobacteria bacterium]|nr:tryptophan-rich sensory protein [Alphaproteobacteria bacterium]
MKKSVIFLLFVALPLIGGKISGFVSGDIAVHYKSIVQPDFSPPGMVFPIVWTILYLLMGISSWMVYTKAVKNKNNPNYFLRPYSIQLALNYLWSPIFFGLGYYWVGAWLALLLTAMVIGMIIRFSFISKVAATLQIPYMLWLIFATYLSFGVAVLN